MSAGREKASPAKSRKGFASDLPDLKADLEDDEYVAGVSASCPEMELALENGLCLSLLTICIYLISALDSFC